MAGRSPIRRDVYEICGSIVPKNWTAQEGTKVFVLGLDAPGFTGKFKHGDELTIHQQGVGDSAYDFILRMSVKARGPLGAMPAGWRWEAFAAVADVDQWKRVLTTGLEFATDDVAVNLYGRTVADVDSKVSIGIRLLHETASADVVEVEIPALYVDKIVKDELSGSRIAVVNRSPSPNEVDVDDETAIDFVLMSVVDGRADQDHVRIYVDDVMVWDAQTSFSHPDYTFDFDYPASEVLVVRITRSGAYESLHQATIRVMVTSDPVLDVTGFPPRLVYIRPDAKAYGSYEPNDGTLYALGDFGSAGSHMPTSAVYARLTNPSGFNGRTGVTFETANAGLLSLYDVAPTGEDITFAWVQQAADVATGLRISFYEVNDFTGPYVQITTLGSSDKLQVRVSSDDPDPFETREVSITPASFYRFIVRITGGGSVPHIAGIWVNGVEVSGSSANTGDPSIAVWTAGAFMISNPTANAGSFGQIMVLDGELDGTQMALIDEYFQAFYSGVSYDFDVSWGFTVEDLTTPRVVAAAARTHEVVRVTWDEPVKAEDASEGDDALNPDNWTVEPLDAPAVTVRVVSAERAAPNMIDLTLDIPMTRDARYEVRVANVVDATRNANEVEVPDDTATFTGYACDVPARRRFELWWMLADADRMADATRDLYKLCAILQEPLDLLLCDIDRFTDIIDVDVAEERYVDQMLIQLGNPFDFELELTDKRRLVRLLVRIYQQKGTRPGIINVIRFFIGVEVTIEAYNLEGWILGEGELGEDAILGPGTQFAIYAFDVRSPVALTEDQRDRIAKIVDYMKPAHTHFVRLLEPEIPEVIDHLELGLSELDASQWQLH